MNVKLSFAPVSRSSFDLLAVVLDEGKTLHAVDDALVASHVERAAAGFRDKQLKREYYATLPDGAPGQGAGRLLEPADQELQPVGEREDLHGARAAPGARLPHAAGRASC